MDLQAKAKHIRELILTALAEAGSGHTGGSLDLVDIFTVLYFNHLAVCDFGGGWLFSRG